MKTAGVLIIALAFWALPTKATATPLCGSLTNVMDYNAQGGCTIDGLLFSDFLVSPGTPGSPDDIFALGSQVVNGVVLFFLNPNLGVGNSAEDIHFFFKVSSLSGDPSIFGVDLENLGGGSTNITETVCSAAFVGLSCAFGSGSVLGSLAAASGGNDVAFFDPRSTIYIFKDIAVGANEAHMSNFTQSFHVVPDGGSTVALLGAGLLGLRMLRRRFRKEIEVLK